MDQAKILYYLNKEQSDSLFSEAASIQKWERIWTPTSVLPGSRHDVDLNEESMKETKLLIGNLFEDRIGVIAYWFRLLPKEYIPLQGRWGKPNSHLKKMFHVPINLPKNCIFKLGLKSEVISELDKYRDSVLDIDTQFVNYHYINQSDAPFYLLIIEQS